MFATGGGSWPPVGVVERSYQRKCLVGLEAIRYQKALVFSATNKKDCDAH